MKTWNTGSGYQITRISAIRFNAYLIRTHKLNILVDTGVTFTGRKLMQYLQRTRNQVDYLVLTHTHFDHCQNAAAIQSATGCKIIIAGEAENFVKQGYTPIPEGTNIFTRWLVWAGRKLRLRSLEYRPFSGDILVHTAYDFKDQGVNIRIIKTPGHSSDSISIIIDDEIAITGDILFGVFRNGIFPPFADDIPKMIKSWKLLLESRCNIFLPGHGSEISRELLKKYYQKYK